MLVGIDRELLAESQLNDRLFPPTPEQGGERRDYDRYIPEETSDHTAILQEGWAKIESDP